MGKVYRSTNIDLVNDLKAFPEGEVKYAKIITKAELYDYHDFKSILTTPKLELTFDLSRFPELEKIYDRVCTGYYDEIPDEEDKKMIQKIINDHLK